jgi:aryl-alcohol dehydrogenase-like predicted oxidoreductase
MVQFHRPAGRVLAARAHIEQELVPMASEFGLGITPWSPLKSGVLSGKYTRANSGQHNADRGAMVDAFLNDKTYALIDELEIIAKAHRDERCQRGAGLGSRAAGVSSVIIGARRLSQLDDNIRAVDVNLSAEELARLDALTQTEVRIPAQHAGDGTGHSQRRNDGQRCRPRPRST